MVGIVFRATRAISTNDELKWGSWKKLSVAGKYSWVSLDSTTQEDETGLYIGEDVFKDIAYGFRWEKRT
jgi:hypothetical protein